MGGGARGRESEREVEWEREGEKERERTKISYLINLDPRFTERKRERVCVYFPNREES